METSDTSVVCDAGPLIHLGQLEAADLLADFAQILVPGQVWAEVSHHFPSVLDPTTTMLTRSSVAIPADARFHALVRAFALDLGEQAALALMARNPQSIFLTDDTAARLAAQSLGYRVHGTLGVIVRAARRNLRTPHAVVDLLQAIPVRSTLHIRPTLLQQVVAQVRQTHAID